MFVFLLLEEISDLFNIFPDITEKLGSSKREVACQRKKVHVRLLRQLYFFTEYDFTEEYRAESENAPADNLSRYSLPDLPDAVSEEGLLASFEENDTVKVDLFSFLRGIFRYLSRF